MAAPYQCDRRPLPEQALRGLQAHARLTRDNNGAAFVYTSNVQLISKVYLLKTSQPDVCTLSKKDKKMLLEGMKRMVAPEGGEGPLG